MNKEITQIMAVVNLAENLKCVRRHSWTSDGRHESVAEHTWRMSLMVMLVSRYLDKDVDNLKILKMVIVHDLVEAICGDIPAFDLLNNKENREVKERQERSAINEIACMAPALIGQEIKALWEEFEDGNSYEAKVALALDKLEAQIQHNEADISTWTEIEKSMAFRLGCYTDFDSFIDELRLQIEDVSVRKLNNAGLLADEYRQS